MSTGNDSGRSKPRITVFLCSHCLGKRAADSTILPATGDSAPYSLRFMCAHEITDDDLGGAYAAGADGILVYGCPLRDCDTGQTNAAILRRLYRHRMVLKKLEVAAFRLREEWAVPDIERHLADAVADFSRCLATKPPLVFSTFGRADTASA